MATIVFNSKYVHDDKAVVFKGHYGNGDPALVLRSSFGEPLCTPTVNLEAYGEHPAEGNVFLYGDYAEHEGVWQGLHKAGVVGNVIRIIQGPHDAEFYECPLLRTDLATLS